jgi:uracil-DNA glycosylase
MTKREKLENVFQSVKDCQLCRLGKTRTRLVFGEQNADSKVVFIGEGPGREEDLQGRPFVGRSGQLLSDAIFEAFQWNRDDYYITNLVKCRPTVNLEMAKDRPPEKDEIEACNPILLRQLEIIQPLAIVTVGSSSTKALLNTTKGITSIRGTWHDYHGIPVLPVFHPSYVLRNGGKTSAQYKTLVEDLLLVKDLIQ